MTATSSAASSAGGRSKRTGRHTSPWINSRPAPAGLHDRVTLAVALAAAEASLGHRPSRRQLAAARLRATFARPRLRLVAAASLVVALAAGGALTWLTVAGRAAADPPQVAAVAAMVTPGSVPANALRAGEHLMVAHQPLVVRAYELEGGEVVVATSVQPFPVPATSHRLSGPSSRAWMAAKGRLSMYGVNRPGGQQSMFLVAAMPMASCPGSRPVCTSSKALAGPIPGYAINPCRQASLLVWPTVQIGVSRERGQSAARRPRTARHSQMWQGQ